MTVPVGVAALAAAGSPGWNATAFAALSGAVVLLFLVLARASQSMLRAAEPEEADAGRRTGDGSNGTPEAVGPPGGAPGSDRPPAKEPDPSEAVPSGAEPPDSQSASGPSSATTPEPPAEATATRSTPDSSPTGGGTRSPAAALQSLGTPALLANVLATHGLFALVTAGAAVYWAVPPGVFGVGGAPVAAVGWGLVLGGALYVADELGAVVAARFGVSHDETLRSVLAPSTPGGWGLLFGGVLPVIAVGEEFLFRGVLVGAYAAGLGVPAWGLAVASSVAFALGHGAQGRGGVLVTGLLGFVLAAAFVVSGSLLLVVVAHYVVNALEFGVHEGLGVELLPADGD